MTTLLSGGLTNPQTYYIIIAIGSFFDFGSVTLPLLDKGTQITN